MNLLNTETIITIIPIIILTISQIILLIQGKVSSAKTIEEKKESYINKLIKKHNKTEEKYIKESEKIARLKGDRENE